jgi:metal-responsive CopG/Arc/MetJ family transcriptional regulator
MIVMKTTISIPVSLFKSAERLSRQLSLSRSQLYVAAIKEFLLAHKKNNTTKRINEAHVGAETSLDPVLQHLQARSLSRNAWRAGAGHCPRPQ